MQRLSSKPKLKEQYGDLLAKFKKLYAEREAYARARAYYIELIYNGIEAVSYAMDFKDWDQALEDGSPEEELNNTAEKLKKGIAGQFKNYDFTTDRNLFAAVLNLYYNKTTDAFRAPYLTKMHKKYKGDYSPYADEVYEKSVFTDQERMTALLEQSPKKALARIRKDPVYQLMKGIHEHYRAAVYDRYYELNDELDALSRLYMGAQLELFPEKRYYPDANSTLRLSYGQVDGYEPRDGVDYHYQTYLSGVMEKYVPGDYEFDLPERLIHLYEQKDYGIYADATGKMPVCFAASNHTTGGNSGSPVLNGKGNLIGLNFDRAWEGTMSDINYDISRCRNISVDIRYVLFIIDKFAGAGYLLGEMTLIKPSLKAKQLKEKPRTNIEESRLQEVE